VSTAQVSADQAAQDGVGVRHDGGMKQGQGVLDLGEIGNVGVDEEEGVERVLDEPRGHLAIRWPVRG
jgi:hypothetical protein